MEAHKFADIFPMIEGQAFEELKKDIKEQGLQQTIILYEDKILDGRNRYKACKELGIEPQFDTYKGDKPLEFVISLNLKRRHLNEGQKAVISLDILPMFQEEAKKRLTLSMGRGIKGTPLMEEVKGESAEQVGKILGVGKSYIYEAKKLKETRPDLLEVIRRGEKTLSEVKSDLKIEVRKEYITQQREAIKNGTHGLPSGSYEVIVIDPPWEYGHVDEYAPDYYMSRVASPYPEMNLEQIKNIKLPASENCVLWLWTTHKYIFECRDILSSWGFRDVSILTWVKDRMGIGKWLRSQTEYCIMAVKGKPLINLTNQTTVLMAKNIRHSEKPIEFYNMVDGLCVGRKLDYFARDKKEGWDVYGAQVQGGVE
jgi:N6-adenosine-specific RNA methylase IME4